MRCGSPRDPDPAGVIAAAAREALGEGHDRALAAGQPGARPGLRCPGWAACAWPRAAASGAGRRPHLAVADLEAADAVRRSKPISSVPRCRVPSSSATDFGILLALASRAGGRPAASSGPRRAFVSRAGRLALVDEVGGEPASRRRRWRAGCVPSGVHHEAGPAAEVAATARSAPVRRGTRGSPKRLHVRAAALEMRDRPGRDVDRLRVLARRATSSSCGGRAEARRSRRLRLPPGRPEACGVSSTPVPFA